MANEVLTASKGWGQFGDAKNFYEVSRIFNGRETRRVVLQRRKYDKGYFLEINRYAMNGYGNFGRTLNRKVVFTGRGEAESQAVSNGIALMFSDNPSLPFNRIRASGNS